ncbi:hypothetical protein [Candidatus Protochlamydia phocaeensis]|uniref:hypothetical protein n=1 Tax=Candidatus Protochlamydia phocaeensis TaxID=1414722 RepID=UPI000838C01A|nr:hypothetical protein [Candidatus Protochlamydia phocaeensis]
METDYSSSWQRSDSFNNPLLPNGNNGDPTVQSQSPNLSLSFQIKSTLSQADVAFNLNPSLNHPILTPPDEINIATNTNSLVQLVTILNSATQMIQEALDILNPNPAPGVAANQSQMPGVAAGQSQTADGATAPDGSQANTGLSNDSMLKFLTVLGKALTDLRQLEHKIEQQEATDTRALAHALETLSKLHGNGTGGKLDLLNKLEDLRQNGAQQISTGERYILGEHPDLMLQLASYGIMPPTAGGGPYDGMAQAYANNNTPPYDNPIYQGMAQALPGGWEELSGSELDQVINKLKSSIAKDMVANMIGGSGLGSFLMRTSLESSLGIFNIMHLSSDSKLIQLMLLRQQLEDFKEQGPRNISSGERFILGERPDLMLQLANAGIYPPMNGGGPYDGMARTEAANGNPPYDNPIYQTMANSLPTGWEELSSSELDNVLNQLDNQINSLSNNFAPNFLSENRFDAPWNGMFFSPAFGFGGFGSSFDDIFSPATDIFGRFNPAINNMLGDLIAEVDPMEGFMVKLGFRSADQVVNDLLTKVILNQSLAFSLALELGNPFDPPSFAIQTLDNLVASAMINSMVEDLMGFPSTSLFEREMMKDSLISFAVLITLSNHNSASFNTLSDILQSVAEQRPDLAFYTAIGLSLLTGSQRPNPESAVREIVKRLADKVGQDQDQLEDIRLLEALLMAMMKKLLQGLLGSPQQGGPDPSGSDGQGSGGNTTFIIQG